jgi:hypothetical protein
MFLFLSSSGYPRELAPDIYRHHIEMVITVHRKPCNTNNLAGITEPVAEGSSGPSLPLSG